MMKYRKVKPPLVLSIYYKGRRSMQHVHSINSSSSLHLCPDHVTTDLQSSVLGVRVVPIDLQVQILSKPRSLLGLAGTQPAIPSQMETFSIGNTLE